MFFKGASQCCTPVSVKEPSLRRLLLALSLCWCASEAHHRTAGAPPLLRLPLASCMFACVSSFISYHLSPLFTDDPRQRARVNEL